MRIENTPKGTEWVTTLEQLRSNVEELRQQSEALQETVYALSQDYYALWRVDLNKNVFYLQRDDHNRAAITMDGLLEMDYTEAIRGYIQRFVHPDDQERLLRDTSIENIRRVLRQEPSFVVRVRRRAMPDSVDYGYG